MFFYLFEDMNAIGVDIDEYDDMLGSSEDDNPVLFEAESNEDVENELFNAEQEMIMNNALIIGNKMDENEMDKNTNETMQDANVSPEDEELMNANVDNSMLSKVYSYTTEEEMNQPILAGNLYLVNKSSFINATLISAMNTPIENSKKNSEEAEMNSQYSNASIITELGKSVLVTMEEAKLTVDADAEMDAIGLESLQEE